MSTDRTISERHLTTQQEPDSPMQDALRDDARRNAAPTQAGAVLDEALRQLVNNGHIYFLSEPLLVDRMHQSLNAIATLIGKPWREQSTNTNQHTKGHP